MFFFASFCSLEDEAAAGEVQQGAKELKVLFLLLIAVRGCHLPNSIKGPLIFVIKLLTSASGNYSLAFGQEDAFLIPFFLRSIEVGG